jgi:hypothetical protein
MLKTASLFAGIASATLVQEEDFLQYIA